MCIAQKLTINQANRKVSNSEIYFKSSDQMINIFEDIPEIIENNFRIAIKCNYYPKEILQKLPKFSNDQAF